MIRTTRPLLLAALLMLHDAGLANHGHDELDGSAHQGKALPVHEGHHPGEGQPDDGGEDADLIEEPCGVPRLTPARVSMDDGAAASMKNDLTSMAPVLATFAAVSPSLIDQPPVHPPDVQRALFEVYRI
jgi:hypothetical protein